ncbi:MAG: hypothetical protein U1E46_07400 [Hyphomicrobiales bacterium]
MTHPDEFNVFFAGDQIAAMVFLLALTMIVHGTGMVSTMQMAEQFDEWLTKRDLRRFGIATLIVAALLIVTVHFLEVGIWSAFFYITGAVKDASDSFYFTLLEYVTLGSNINLPFRWRNLEGAIAMSGLLTFAWSTSVLMALVSRYQHEALEHRRQRRTRNGEVTKRQSER